MPMAAAGMAAVLLAAPALADGYAHAPFRDHPADLARAAAVERVMARLDAGLPVAEDHLAPFLASLRLASPEAADALEAAVARAAQGDPPGSEAALEAAAAGVLGGTTASDGSPGAAASPAVAEAQARPGADLGAKSAGEPVRAAAEGARDALFPEGYGARPGFGAALAATLLLSEEGVAEAYEEAAEGEAGAYPFAWAALGRVRPLVPETEETAATLARLDALLPGPERPGRLASDPEEAEGHAQMLVGLMEPLADAELYPGRDLGAALTTVADLAARGCGAAHGPEVGAELMLIAAGRYEETLGATLGVLAPGAHEAIAGALEAPGDCAALAAGLERAGEALAPMAVR